MGQEVKNPLRAQSKYGLMGSSAKTGKKNFWGSPEHFLDKNDIWDRTTPHLYINCSLHVWRWVQGSQIFKRNSIISIRSKVYGIFRWFKFTLKPPYSIAHDKLRLAIGTLPFGLFGSNLDTKDLETYAWTYSGHFWNMSIFDDSRAIWVLSRKWVVSENQSFLNEGAIVTPLIGLVLGGEVPRLNHGPICFPIQNT